MRYTDAEALDALAHLLTHGLAGDGTWDGAADHLDAVAEIVRSVRTIVDNPEYDQEDD